MGSATAVVPKPPPSEEGGYSVVHPAHLDIAFQATFAALTAPDNGSMWSAFVPTTIERLLINPALCLGKAATGESLMDTSIIDQVRPLGTKAATISADIGIYNYDTGEMEIQVDNLLLTALSRSSASDDRQFFSNTVWDMDIASGIAIISEEDPLVDCQVIDLGERVSYYYLRNLVLSVPKEDRNVLEWHHQRLLEFGEDIISRVDSGDHPTVKKDWADDTHEEILNKISKFPGKVDLEIMKAVGENIHSAVLGKTAILEHMMADSMLDRLYKTSVGQARINNYLGKMAKQIAHRYPRMNILEVGGGTGGATKSVLEALNGAFNSYLFTDISPGFFENAQAQFRDYGSKMNYKVLDVEKDVAAQGLREHSYDVIVASNVLHATRNLENTMRNVRRLLKPGGYLLLLEATGELLRVRFVMGGLPGWWLGHEDGRTHGPVISISSWHTLLMKTGFSGVDHSVNDFNDPLRYLCSAMVSQAVNDEVQMIRQPFAFSQNIPLADGLLVIGGKTAKTSKLATEMCSLLSFWKDKIVVIPSLMDENLHLLSSTTTVLNLEELDEPVFQSITAAKFKTLQALSVAAKRVLWITHDTRDNNPYGNMMVGLGRSILSESPHLQLQFLSLEGSQVVEPDARALSVNLLRMLLADMPALSDGSILWTAEPELVLNNTKLLIPRIKSLGEMDDRLNSSRRFITKAVNPNLFPVEKIWTGSSYGLREQNFIHGEEDCLKLHITQSTVEAIRVGIGNYLFLCLGTDFETGAEVITLSKSNASLIEAPPTLIQEYNEQPYGSLRSVALSLYAQALVARLPEKGNLLHELDLDLATAVYDLANEQQKEVFFTMSKSIGAMCSLPWTFIHAQSSPRSIKSILPQDIKYFVDASGGGLGSLSSRVAQCLPLTCEKEIIRAFSSPTSRLGHYSSLRDIEYALARACRHSLSLRSQNEGDLLGGMIPVTESINNPVTTVPSTIMNWPSATSLSVPVNPVDTQPLFQNDKTYLLIGLGGELGQSLCRWMAANGVKYIVVAHRSPGPDKQWLEELRSLGVRIDVLPLDIADRTSLKSVYNYVCANWPPIAGVTNGAMVLNDKMFVDMSFEDFDKVLRPKVLGSQYLDEIFEDQVLDFFIMFSSLVCVFGNPGQSNYSTANMFMTGLAAQRRRRGLAASVMDIGMVLGIGYISRTGSTLVEDNLRKNNCLPISESDIHAIFGEAIVAGRPDSKQNPEIIAGLERVSAVERGRKPPWHGNPRLSHHVYDNTADDTQESSKVTVSIKEQLAAAKSDGEALEVLKKRLSSQLELMLMLAPDSMHVDVALTEMGVDSLVAVEIRGWFLKRVNIDMPVFKILGGASVTALCLEAVGSLNSA